MDWIVDRIKEASTHNGVIVAAGAAAVLFMGLSLTEVVLWVALAWGVWSVLRSD
jgi:hypothetical protein